MMPRFDTQTGTDTALAARYLQQGHCVAIPTETVYGLAAHAFDEAAVSQIFRIKERPPSNPLIVHLPSANHLEQVADSVPEMARTLLHHFAPGPLTVLLPRRENLPTTVTAGLPHVAVRIPAHPLTQELLRTSGLPLAAPSANLYTRISPTTAAHVFSQLQGRIPYILDGGPCTRGIESTIVGFEGDTVQVYRLGSISLEALQVVAPRVVLRNSGDQPVVAPGMHHLHYAPRKPLVLTNDVAAAAQELGSDIVIINFAQKKPGLAAVAQLVLSATGNLEEAARNLYAALHQADGMPATLIVAERLPDTGTGRAINDRLKRAAH